MDGFLNVHKPAGLTSHDVVDRIRKGSREKHVGHGGTLDPFATGVLPVGLGYGTRLLEFIAGPKIYQAEMEFGAITDTYDVTGTVTERHDASGLRREQIEAASQRFLGQYLQYPPLFSAVKLGGRRLYHYARQGIEIERPPRLVSITRIDVISWESTRAVLEVECGRGTYVRSLTHDLGQALGCGAYLKELVRTQDGSFLLSESVSLADLEVAFSEGTWASLLYPLDFTVRGWPAITLTPQKEQEVLQGKILRFLPEETPALALVWSEGGEQPSPEPRRCRASARNGALVALLEYQSEKDCWHPFKVFPPRPSECAR